MMVFIALPALQRSQRDTQRKNDLSRLKVAIDNYKSNNRGSLPWSVHNLSWTDFSDDSFGQSYLKADQGDFKDPRGTGYRFTFDARGLPWSDIDGYREDLSMNIHISRGTKCSGSGASRVTAGGINNYSIQIKLEGGGAHCLDG